jgi:hypothetical protein
VCLDNLNSGLLSETSQSGSQMKREQNKNSVPDLSIIDFKAGGLEYCPDCNGYGSSLKDLSGNYRCDRCGGAGAIQIRKGS